jgi:hypothetical protein
VNTYGRSLLRFWWVLVIGLAVAQGAAIVAVYRVDFSTMPPTLTEREKPSYSAQGRLLVTDSENPHLRLTVKHTVQPTATPEGEVPRTVEVAQAPDIATLVQAANLYPILIESDQVSKIREKRFGTEPGTLRAQAIYAVSSPSRFTPSRVPVIQVIAVSSTPKDAIDLVTHTNWAFMTWMAREQTKAGIKERERIMVQPVQMPVGATQFGGASSTLPVLVFGVVFMAFVALAIFFDRAFPRREVVVAEPASEPVRSSA